MTGQVNPFLLLRESQGVQKSSAGCCIRKNQFPASTQMAAFWGFFFSVSALITKTIVLPPRMFSRCRDKWESETMARFMTSWWALWDIDCKSETPSHCLSCWVWTEWVGLNLETFEMFLMLKTPCLVHVNAVSSKLCLHTTNVQQYVLRGT